MPLEHRNCLYNLVVGMEVIGVEKIIDVKTKKELSVLYCMGCPGMRIVEINETKKRTNGEGKIISDGKLTELGDVTGCKNG